VHPRVSDALQRLQCPYKVHRHDALPLPVRSPADFAAQLGYDLGRITKSLLVRSTGADRYAVVVSPMGKKIDFGAVARLINVKRVEVASCLELANHTGYPEKGVSPLGVEQLPVFLDEMLFQFPTVLVGAGEVGVEVELSPDDLQRATGGTRAAVSVR
jgi:Cys-tRNA(Pro)/Cys-tRNA(Cys) deacylase